MQGALRNGMIQLVVSFKGTLGFILGFFPAFPSEHQKEKGGVVILRMVEIEVQKSHHRSDMLG